MFIDCSYRILQMRETLIPLAAEFVHTVLPGFSSTLLSTQCSISGVGTDQGLARSDAHGAKDTDSVSRQ
jgi:hypothetical protein